MKFPSIKSVGKELVAINHHIENKCDVRLQVYEDGAWVIRFGLSDYDQDHHGYWGASGIPGSGKRMRSREIAADLLSQAKDQYSQSESNTKFSKLLRASQ